MNGAIQQSQAEWNILLYMAADDVLANFAIESVKQLRRAAKKNIVVAVQLDVDGPFARQRLRRFIFDGSSNQQATIDQDVVMTLDPGTNMVDPRTLTDFIDWAFQQPRCSAKHHCLILWGHGPELLDEPAPSGSEILKAPVDGGNGKVYLTPPQFATALNRAGRGLNIIAFDACSSSIAELADELTGYADFMVASQEDVPDMSFPYDLLLRLFESMPEDVQGICKTGVEKYLTTYQDYVFGANTDTSKVTLSSLDLRNFKTTKDAIKHLAEALLSAMGAANLRSLILEARKAAHGFVSGLFVDLSDFCERLADQLKGTDEEKLREACQEVINSLKVGGKYSCVIANAVLDPRRCHGLSLYLPFLTDGDMDQPLVKGGTDILAKGGTDILAKGGTDILAKVRRQRITETEAYYPDLTLSHETRWYEFIRDGWSRILAEQLPPDELDVRYSAQQCAVNLLASSASNLQNVASPEAGTSPSSSPPAKPPRQPKGKSPSPSPDVKTLPAHGLQSGQTNRHDSA